MEVPGPDPLLEGVEQHLLQGPPVDRELRPRVAGGPAPVLTPDLLTPPGAVDEQLRGDRLRLQCVEQAEGVQLPHGVGQQVDADPERPDLVDRLEHVDLDPDLVEAQRRRQAADPGADDHDLGHRTSCTSMNTRFRSRRPVDTPRIPFSRSSRGAAVNSRMWVRK